MADGPTGRCSLSQIVRATQVTTTRRYQPAPPGMAVVRAERAPAPVRVRWGGPCTPGQDHNAVQPRWTNHGPSRLRAGLPQEQDPLPGPAEETSTGTGGDTCMPAWIAASQRPGWGHASAHPRLHRGDGGPCVPRNGTALRRGRRSYRLLQRGWALSTLC